MMITIEYEIYIHTYIVPSNAASMSSSEGVVLFLSRVYMDMTKPGVQNPHCEPWALAILSYTQHKRPLESFDIESVTFQTTYQRDGRISM